MNPAPAPLVLRLLMDRLAVRAAAVAGALLAAAPAAAQPTPCDSVSSAAWGHHMVPAYQFSFLSGVRGRGAAAHYLHCVRNNHRQRAVDVDWRGAGLRSPIPPGGTIFQSGPLAGRANARRPFALYYGGRPSMIQVMTLAGAGELSWPPARLPANPLFRRAAWWQEAPAAASAADVTTSLVYLPAYPDLRPQSARRSSSRAEIVEWLESHPEQLRPFSMIFENDVVIDAQGRVTITYTCRYAPQGEAFYYLEFSDPEFQRTMFGNSTYPVSGIQEYPPVASASLEPAHGRVVTRTVQLRVLLDDRRTVVASIPVVYSALAGS